MPPTVSRSLLLASALILPIHAQADSFKRSHPEIRYASPIDAQTVVGLRFSGAFQSGHPVGGVIAVFKRGPKGWREAWTQKNLNPWKLTTADFGGGSRYILAGVWKKSPHDMVLEKRVFIYTWDGTRLMPKWLSSRLGRRFDDFGVIPSVKGRGPRLIALERGAKGMHLVSTYKERAFGFDWVASSNEVPDAEKLEIQGSKVSVVGNKKRYRLILSNEQPHLREYQ